MSPMNVPISTAPKVLSSEGTVGRSGGFETVLLEDMVAMGTKGVPDTR